MGAEEFRFKQFTIKQERSAFRVGTDGVLLGAWAGADQAVDVAMSVLDIGTGTGLIALMVAQRFPEASITAIEPDHDSCEQACRNILNSSWNNRIRVLNCTVQDFDPGDEKFDLIVTNPPFFIDSLRNPDTAGSMARHNVTIGHSDIIDAALRLMNEKGRLDLIMPYPEGSLFIALSAEKGLFCNRIIKVRPLPSAPVKRLIISMSRKRELVSERFLTIEKGNRHEYTDDYIDLTRDFYLRF